MVGYGDIVFAFTPLVVREGSSWPCVGNVGQCILAVPCPAQTAVVPAGVAVKHHRHSWTKVPICTYFPPIVLIVPKPRFGAPACKQILQRREYDAAALNIGIERRTAEELGSRWTGSVPPAPEDD
jgi:hypothetical protein